jgi:hypothetical protein
MIGTDTAEWTSTLKAIRKIGGTGNASVAVMLASTWIAELSCNLGGIGEGDIIRPASF